MRKIIALALTTLFVVFVFSCQESEAEQKKRELAIHNLRFLGKANLENDELDEAEKAYLDLLELVTDDPSVYANLALVYLKQNKYDAAQTQLKKALRKAPDDPDIRMIAARYYELTQQPEKAIAELEKIIEQQPGYAMAYYNLAEIYAQTDGSTALANREKFLQLTMEKAPGNIVPRINLINLLVRKGDYDSASAQLEELPKIFSEFPEQVAVFYDKTMAAVHSGDTAAAAANAVMLQNFLKVTTQYQSDLRDLKGPEGNLAGLSVISLSDFDKTYAEPGESVLPRIRFLDVTDQVQLGTRSAFNPKPEKASEVSAHFAFGDYNDDGYTDIYFSSFSAQDSVTIKRLLKNNFGKMFFDQTRESDILHSGRETAAIFGDYDNDGYFDLYVVKNGPNLLYKNKGNGVFTEVAATAGVDDPEPGNTAIFLDADHDGDLDLLVTRSASNLLYRNNADGTFTEKAADMGLGLPIQNSSAATFADFDDDGDLDLFLANSGAAGHLLSNERHGRFQDAIAGSGLQDTQAATTVAAADYNNDGFTDLLLLAPQPGSAALYAGKGNGRFTRKTGQGLQQLRDFQPRGAVFLDFDNNGFLDLLVAGRPADKNGRGLLLFHNDGTGNFEDASNLLPAGITTTQQVGALDYDKDGDLDIFITDQKGELRLLQNEGGNLNHYLNIQLVGLRNGNNKNNHFGIGAKVEIRAGALYQMKVVTEPNIHFGLGSRLKADVLRVTWTNGVAQNKFYPGSDQELLELQSLKGSCAFLYTWNGKEYVFSKDMMWRSALGMPLGIMGANTAYAPADPSKEYLKIPGEQMQPQDGRYTVQITEELWETAYFDKLELVALDHPQDEQVWVDERFTLPPYTDQYNVHTVQKRIPPVAAMDGAGTNLLPMILEKDDNYVSNFQLGAYQGITETHDLVLDPGSAAPSDNMLLFLTGWIFPSDASINVALGQSGKLQVIPPQLQVLDRKGTWVTVISNMGFPMGKDKTMIIDLSGKFLSKDRRVRIRTNMEIYWDAIFFAPKVPRGTLTATRLKPVQADLHYRGFSRLYRKGGRHGPHWFDYQSVTRAPKWRDLIGAYTRFGDVTPLLIAADDKLVIMNSGDEMTVTFDASALPPLPAGWKRDFLIYSEGWIKDGDLNTAHGKTVEPLPFHGMTRYPYGADEAFPDDHEHRAYRQLYNTRKVDTRTFRRELLDMQ
ncbi:MAG: tetratricopeptide repeat protein [Bacteroidetes bacterium]|nr:MAG: tetratricopeptide repeat protein [Bacteroidota bacterium]